MLLEGRNAVIYGGGRIGGAVARGFIDEGARVFLAGRNQEKLERLADELRFAGGKADVAIVDALDEVQVEAHADKVVAEAGSLDISFNLITHGDVQGTPMVDMEVEDYLAPVVNGVRTLFITAKAAALHMKKQRSGVILIFGGAGDPMRGYNLGGLQTGFEAMESMRRQLASELGPDGIRVVTLRSGGVPESFPEGFEGREKIIEDMEKATMLGRAASFEDVGNVAAFVASDKARTMTASTVNVSCGTLIDHQ